MQNKIGRQAMAEASKHYRKAIRAETPRDSGSLRKEIRFKIRRSRKGQFKGIVGPTKKGFYAQFIEFGTAPHRVPSEYRGSGRNKRKNSARIVIGDSVYSAANVSSIKDRDWET